MADEEAIFDALGDATRRRTLELLRRSGERSVRELTDSLPMTQSAVSQHLKVLKNAGLVTDRAVGTKRLYRVDLDGFATVRAYVDRFWDDALTAFVLYAESQPTRPKKEKPSDRRAHTPKRTRPA